MVMPNFLIVGAPKAGTTSLYRYLQQHPQIYMSPVKEPYFFAFDGEQLDFQGPGDSEKKYITNVDSYEALFESKSDEVAIGEASPGYLASTSAPERIRKYIPDAKMIAILRDPVERAYSQYLSLVFQNLEPITDFAQAMRAEETRIRAKWLPRWRYRQRGFYGKQLKRYLHLFDQRQIRVYLYEDFRSDPLSVVQDVSRFLGVDETFVPNMSEKHNVTWVYKNEALHRILTNPNPAKSLLGPLFPIGLRARIRSKLMDLNLTERPRLSPETRSHFIEEYREDILELQELIQRDLSKWLQI